MESLEKSISKVEQPEKILEIGAKEFVNDLRKLPKPMTARTHLRPCFERNKEKYYNHMIKEIFD